VHFSCRISEFWNLPGQPFYEVISKGCMGFMSISSNFAFCDHMVHILKFKFEHWGILLGGILSKGSILMVPGRNNELIEVIY